MKNILITGGAGFIGSTIALKLIAKGYNVTVLDNLSQQIHGDDPDVSFLYSRIKNKVRFYKGHVFCRDDMVKAMEGQDAIIHLAAETGTGQSMYEIERYTNENIGGTALMLDILANSKNNIRKVLVAESRAIYGEGRYICKDHGFVYPNERSEADMVNGYFECKCPVCDQPVELTSTTEDSLVHPSSVYGITKQVQGQMVHLVCKAIGIPSVSFRYQNVYGPGQSLKNPYTGILSIFSTNLLYDQPLNIFEDGNETRDFVYIDDVADATILGLEQDTANYQAFNIGSGERTSVISVANYLKKEYNSKSTINITGDFRIGDIRHNFADISKARKFLGYEPKYTFERGISEFANWVKKEKIEKNDSYAQSIIEMKKKGLMKNNAKSK
jgi:Nucleoside-diphosphate-sugar epimerases